MNLAKLSLIQNVDLQYSDEHYFLKYFPPFKMIELVPGTNVCIPFVRKATIFSSVTSRGDLAGRLLRCFYNKEEITKAVSLTFLPMYKEIIPAIIGNQ